MPGVGRGAGEVVQEVAVETATDRRAETSGGVSCVYVSGSGSAGGARARASRSSRGPRAGQVLAHSAWGLVS